MKSRDDFSPQTRRELAGRAGWLCSICKRITSGPSRESPTSVAIFGIGAHICAAASGGRRYDAAMTPGERKHINNGIWLCAICAVKVDRDDVTYTVENLHSIKEKHEAACAEASPPTTIMRPNPSLIRGTDTDGLIAIGPRFVFGGELYKANGNVWEFLIRNHIIGDVGELLKYSGAFYQQPAIDNVILVTAWGEGRVLAAPPSIFKTSDGHVVQCRVLPAFPRIKAQSLLPDMALSPDNDLLEVNGDIAVVAGLDALPQKIKTCLSLRLGESPFHQEFGSRLSEIHDEFRNSAWITELLTLEVIRQASIPYFDEISNSSYTPLQCVNFVRRFSMLDEGPKGFWYPVEMDLDVAGVGRWQHKMSICFPPPPEQRPGWAEMRKLIKDSERFK